MCVNHVLQIIINLVQQLVRHAVQTVRHLDKMGLKPAHALPDTHPMVRPAVPQPAQLDVRKYCRHSVLYMLEAKYMTCWHRKEQPHQLM